MYIFFLGKLVEFLSQYGEKLVGGFGNTGGWLMTVWAGVRCRIYGPVYQLGVIRVGNRFRRVA